MTPVERLKEMIGKLSPQELAELRAWVSAQASKPQKADD